jgi:hypothetical protein
MVGLFLVLRIKRVIAFSENLNNVAHLKKEVIQPKTWSWGRRLAWSTDEWRQFFSAQMAMFLLHFSAFSSLFFLFLFVESRHFLCSRGHIDQTAQTKLAGEDCVV